MPDILPIPSPAGQRPATFDEPTLRRFLSYIVDPYAGATELRILNAQYESADVIAPNPKYSSTLSAWYDNPNAIVNDARKLRQVSAYICLNPTTPDLLGRSYNRLTKVRNATTDDDIVCLRWFYIDVDPVRPADISATHEELAAAVAKRDEILNDHPEIRRVSLTGRSGNGAFIMARLPDYPNDHEHRSLVAAALDSIIAKYSDSRIKIDVKTKNPSRVGCVPGTLKCKGSHIPARPWKMATLEGVPEAGDDGPDGSPGPPPTLDLRAWLARNPAPVALSPVRPVAHQGPRANSHGDDANRLRRAEAYVGRMPGAVSGQGGHDATFAVACALVKGFDLTTGEAGPVIHGYNMRCSPPWSTQEIAHKLKSADEWPDDKARGYLFDADRPGWEANPPWEDRSPAPPTPTPVLAPVAHAIPPGKISVEVMKRRANHHLAEARIEALYQDREFLADLARLERENVGAGEAVKAIVGRIKEFKVGAFKAVMAEFRKVAHRKGGGDGAGDPGQPGNPGEPPPFDPSDMGNADLLLAAHGHEMRFVKAYGDWVVNDGKRWNEDKGNVAGQWVQEVPGMIGAQITPEMDDDEVEAVRTWQLKSKSNERLRAALSVAMPRVTSTPETFDRDPWLFNCQNGTIDLRTGEFREHRPGDFLTKISPVEYDPSAKCPLWDAFVLRIMRNDPETVAYVHRILGYAMTGSVKDHAIFICHGSGGNGKSVLLITSSYVLGDYATELDPEIILAQANAMHPTGLTDLEGRRFVVCEETDDRRGIAEALMKRISGGGKIKARKIGQNYYEFDPTHHLFLATNHLPEVKNDDDGIWRRLKLIPFEVKFDGKSGEKPDPDMAEKLKAEASGILNRLLEGLKDWQANGLFDCPVVQKATQGFREESDKLGSFLSEKTIPVPGEPRARAVFSVLYGEYLEWAAGEGIKHPMSKQKLGRVLNDKGYKTDKDNAITYKTCLLLKINGKDPRKMPGYDKVTGQPPRDPRAEKDDPAAQQDFAYAGGAGDDDWAADRE